MLQFEVLSEDKANTQIGSQPFRFLRILYIGASLGLVAWALWTTSWIFRYGSIRLIEPSALIVSIELVALTIFLALGIILALSEVKGIAARVASE